MVNNIIVFSDIHAGCRFGLCPPQVKLDEGNVVQHSKLQAVVWSWWLEFTNEWIPQVTRGEPYVLVFNGDGLDGDHHGSKSQISHNYSDQINIAKQILLPIISEPQCKGYYHIRGTEAHVGKSAEFEEILARELGAIPNDEGNHARWEMWMRFTGGLIHFSHHVGTTSSAAYESTAVYKELVEAYNEAGRWGEESPDIIVRSHRHRYFKCEVPSDKGSGIAVVTPGWQLKTPFVHRIALGRAGTAHVGGILIRHGDEDPIYTRNFIKKVSRPKEVVI